MQSVAQPSFGPQTEPPAPDLLVSMKAAPIWLLWKALPVPGRVKPRKVPFYVDGTPRSGQLDTPEDRARLVPFAEACAALERSRGEYEGLALALGPDGRGGHWQGVDLDHIESKGLGDEANRWVRGNCAGWGYIERSPGGEGAHIIGYGRAFRALGSNESGIEAYSGGRFFTFTGSAATTDSPHRVVDLADYVEQVLAPRHGAQRADTGGRVELVPIDPKTFEELRGALLHMRADDRDLWVRMGLALRELGERGARALANVVRHLGEVRPERCGSNVGQLQAHEHRLSGRVRGGAAARVGQPRQE